MNCASTNRQGPPVGNTVNDASGWILLDGFATHQPVAHVMLK